MAKHMRVARGRGAVLIIGATGFIGRFIAEASLESGRPTYLLVRSLLSSSSSKANAINSLQHKGAIVLHGMINEKEAMEKMLRENEIEVVISAVGGRDLKDQVGLVQAIKAVGTIKRFLPSEFGHDVDRADPIEPALTAYKEKRKIRRLIEDLGVPHTYICCNSIAAWPYHDKTHDALPPLDQFQIYGDGSVKAYFVTGNDIGKFTIKIVDDVRTLNKRVHFRPTCNFYDIKELACLWETKIGRTLPRITITENDILLVAAENSMPRSIIAALTHDIFFKGCQVNFKIDGGEDVELSSLYPHESFQTLDGSFTDFAAELNIKSVVK
ncbi:LOW QUALITY PROTEIN: leucoanthocyanidin reductase-like [Carica papaya]|uniref:LOW QUALITY PROTEIN: leucoanthocyanidin reductase-like n=1 Tax=Carica papaya TaxID=3649 RepID=UPI000B8CE414|nr:LOW QUALITY PROTEIN: leucoanthocyanidin reductase-like [Carica papaya]